MVEEIKPESGSSGSSRSKPVGWWTVIGHFTPVWLILALLAVGTLVPADSWALFSTGDIWTLWLSLAVVVIGFRLYRVSQENLIKYSRNQLCVENKGTYTKVRSEVVAEDEISKSQASQEKQTIGGLKELDKYNSYFVAFVMTSLLMLWVSAVLVFASVLPGVGMPLVAWEVLMLVVPCLALTRLGAAFGRHPKKSMVGRKRLRDARTYCLTMATVLVGLCVIQQLNLPLFGQEIQWIGGIQGDAFYTLIAAQVVMAVILGLIYYGFSETVEGFGDDFVVWQRRYYGLLVSSCLLPVALMVGLHWAEGIVAWASIGVVAVLSLGLPLWAGGRTYEKAKQLNLKSYSSVIYNGGNDDEDEENFPDKIDDVVIDNVKSGDNKNGENLSGKTGNNSARVAATKLFVEALGDNGNDDDKDTTTALTPSTPECIIS